MSHGRLPLGPPEPLVDLPLRVGSLEEPPFLRPRTRTRMRRARRGGLARALFLLQALAGFLAAVTALWAGYARVMASERLKVSRVEVRGSRFLSEGEVRELLGPAVGENIFRLDLAALKARLRGSPWVADATVRRTLPDALQVEIQERVPLALAELDRLYLMDEEGSLIDVFGPRTASFDLPIVRGLTRDDEAARRERARRAGLLLADLGELAHEVSEVTVEGSGELRVVLRGAGELLRLGAPPYRARLEAFLALRQDLAERCPNAEYFDLRFRDRIYVREAPSAPEPPVAATAPAGGAAPAPAASAPPETSPAAPPPATGANGTPPRGDAATNRAAPHPLPGDQS